MVVIRYKKEFKNKQYYIYVEKTKEVFISIYISDYLFFNSLKNKYPLKHFFLTQGKPNESDKIEILPFLKVLKIELVNQEEELFDL
jgi:hypothetical protein